MPQNENFTEMMDAAKAAFQTILEKDDSPQSWWNNSLRSYFRDNNKIDKPFRRSFDNKLNPSVKTIIRHLEKAKGWQTIQSINEKISRLIAHLDSLTGKPDTYYFDDEPQFTKDINIIWDLFTDLDNLPQSKVLSHPKTEVKPKDKKDGGLSDYKYDAFISHASEDKDKVRLLVDAFKKYNIRCWYDEESMGWGELLEKEINAGIVESKYVIVFISSKYLEKYWTQAEYGGAVTRESQEGKVILPIWYNMTAKDLAEKNPILANKFALDFSIGVDEIAKKLRSMLDKP